MSLTFIFSFKNFAVSEYILIINFFKWCLVVAASKKKATADFKQYSKNICSGYFDLSNRTSENKNHITSHALHGTRF